MVCSVGVSFCSVCSVGALGTSSHESRARRPRTLITLSRIERFLNIYRARRSHSQRQPIYISIAAS